MQIPKSSFLKIVSDFNASPPLRLCEIFNHLSSDPSIRQELAAYISFQEKCLFIDGFTVYLRFYAFYGFTVIVTVKRTIRCFPWLKGHRFFVASSRLISPHLASSHLNRLVWILYGFGWKSTSVTTLWIKKLLFYEWSSFTSTRGRSDHNEGSSSTTVA